MVVQKQHILKRYIGMKINKEEAFSLILVYECAGPVYIERLHNDTLKEMTSEEFNELSKNT